MDLIHVDAGAATSQGRVREVNQDALLVEHPLYVVADGMGGHIGGEVAAELAVTTLLDAAPHDRKSMTAAIVAAHERILRVADERFDGARMGTTVTGMLLIDGQWLVFNVGDSRVYEHLGATVLPITRDDSEVQLLIDRGRITATQARTHPHRHVVTQSLGGRRVPIPAYRTVDLAAGQRFLICSDGLSEELTDDEIAEVMAAVDDPLACASALVDSADASGGRDNTTVVVVTTHD